MKDQLDINDLIHIKRLGHKPIGYTVCPVSNKGVINPHVTQFHLKDNKSVSVFHVKPIYYETRAGFWRPLSEITSYHGNKNIVLNDNWRNAHPRFIDWLAKRQSLLGRTLLLPSFLGVVPSKYQDFVRPTLNIGLTTATVYPDPSPETTTVDGYISNSYGQPGTSWANMYSVQTATAYDSVTSMDVYNVGTHSSPSNYVGFNAGAICLFDTSALGSGASVSDAVLSLRGNTKYDQNSDAPTVAIYSSNPASNTSLTTADHTAMGTTVYSDIISYATLSASAYNDFTLNTDGKNAIDATGISKFAGRNENYIVANVDMAMAAYKGNAWKVNTADSSGTSTDPKLVITYTAGGGGPTFVPRAVWFM